MSDDHSDLLKQLVDAPYGHAEAILKKRGLWDEKRAVSDGTKKTYRVRVDGTMSVSATVRVEATSPEEAEELAEELASYPSFEWKDYGETEVDGAYAESSHG
jgi:hypothetical protein